jgi:hypothetical protein
MSRQVSFCRFFGFFFCCFFVLHSFRRCRFRHYQLAAAIIFADAAFRLRTRYLRIATLIGHGMPLLSSLAFISLILSSFLLSS